jgi:hypothetical protein
MGDQVKTYQIGGKTYEQRELVFGQVMQLKTLLAGMALPEGADTRQFLEALGDNLMPALAIVLVEQGQPLGPGRDLKALAAELEYAITPATIAEVIRDFFTCNPIGTLIDDLTGLAQLVGAVRAGGAPTLSKRSSSSSPEATGAGETPSSGAAPPEPPAPGCGTGSGKSSSGKPCLPTWDAGPSATPPMNTAPPAGSSARTTARRAAGRSR